jgi:hypothetical protein
MTLNAPQHAWVTGRSLRQVTPGFYVDEIGSEYFYLTGLYSKFAHKLLNKPLLNTPALISEVLYDLRCELETFCCTELMD